VVVRIKKFEKISLYIAVNATFVTDERPEERQPCDAVLLSGASSC
jgi:hypothetical protein